MKRTWTDELDRTWDVELGSADDMERGDVVLLFGRGLADERAMPVVGPMEDVFPTLTDEALQHALDATASGQGILLVESDGALWWARGPEADALGGAWTVKFSDGATEHIHRGRLPDPPEDLSEDELLELLDEARGNVMEEMDVSGA